MSTGVAAFFDIDKTVLEINSGTKWISYMRRTGQMSLGQLLRSLTWLLQYRFGLLDYDAMAHKVLRSYAGKAVEPLAQEIEQWFAAEVRWAICSEARSRIAQHRERGELVVLLTSATQFLTLPVARELAIEAMLCTEIEVEAGHFTGRDRTPAGDGAGTGRDAEQFAAERGLDLGASWFYSDSYTVCPCSSAWATRWWSTPTRGCGGSRCTAAGPSRSGARHRSASTGARTMWDSELGDVDEVIDQALREDLSSGDVTARAMVPLDARARARLVAKAETVTCGLPVAGAVFRRLDPDARWHALRREGEAVGGGVVLAEVEGNARALLAAERTALNLVQRMWHRCDRAALRRGRRRPLPRDRHAQDHAGVARARSLRRAHRRRAHHRNDLGAGVLIKENHIRCAGGSAAAILAARAQVPHGMRIECEVTNLVEVDQALAAGCDAILLDNMDDATVAQAVARIAGRAIVEVSGNVELARLPTLSTLGIDLVSVGALTHSVRAADVSLLFEVGG
ncbi:MAG: haloacid dehalogenase-like hydrolase [Nannocystaceae bacterium]